MNENSVFCSKLFCHNTGSVQWFVDYPTSPVLGEKHKAPFEPLGAKVVIVLEFSVGHIPQHNEKSGTIIYSLLFLNDAKRLNVVPAKSSTWKRVNLETHHPWSQQSELRKVTKGKRKHKCCRAGIPEGGAQEPGKEKWIFYKNKWRRKNPKEIQPVYFAKLELNPSAQIWIWWWMLKLPWLRCSYNPQQHRMLVENAARPLEA